MQGDLFDDMEKKAFIAHLEKATETLRSWPKWKRTILGPALPEDREKENGNEN